MTRFEVIEGKSWHCGAIARQIRCEHAREVDALGLRSHEGIAAAFAMSSYRHAWMVDGKLAALGGVIGTELSSQLALWLAVSERGSRYPIAMFKTAKEWMRRFVEGHDGLRTTILLKDETSLRFAQRLGFVLLPGESEAGIGVMEWKGEGE